MRRSILLAAGLIAALLFSAGCKKIGDDAISESLKAKIAADAELKSAGVEAQVKNGEVTLAGVVPSSDVELKAVKLANKEPGVKKVDDRLSVQPAQVALDANGSPAAPVQGPSGADQPPATQPPAGQATPPPPPPAPASVTIPAGRAVSIRMIDTVDSSRNTSGQQFRASLAEPLRVSGKVIAPRGTDVLVRLSQARSAGNISGRSELEMQLVGIRLHGRNYPLVSNRYTEVGKSRGVQTARRTGVGAAAGAIIGALAGGGKGAAIGAAVGGGGTATYQVLTRGQQVRIPSETRLQFILQAPATIEAPQQ